MGCTSQRSMPIPLATRQCKSPFDSLSLIVPVNFFGSEAAHKKTIDSGLNCCFNIVIYRLDPDTGPRRKEIKINSLLKLVQKAFF